VAACIRTRPAGRHPVVIDQRFLHYDGYRNATLYWVPLLAVVIVLPIAYLFGKRAPYT
jgi:hypothetical protein